MACPGAARSTPVSGSRYPTETVSLPARAHSLQEGKECESSGGPVVGLTDGQGIDVASRKRYIGRETKRIER